MDIFKSSPRSFKMDRRCPQASELKASVHRKLVEFLKTYTDDVLAEYIVVLVCNGKHQDQARDDLEAFLGDESGAFVSWLWDHLSRHVSSPEETGGLPSGCRSNEEKEQRNCWSRDLSKNVRPPKPPVGLSQLEAVTVSSGHDDIEGKEQRNCRLGDLQNHATGISEISLSKRGNCYEPSSFSPKLISSNTEQIMEASQRRSTVSNASLADQLAEHNAPHDTGNQVEKCGSTVVRCSPGISAGVGEQCLQYGDQVKKIGNSNCITSARQLLHSAKRESVLRNLQSVVTENLHSGPSSMTNAARTRASVRSAEYVVPSHGVGPRGSVWDRLGKPSEENAITVGERISPHIIDSIKRQKLGRKREGLDKHSLMWVVPGGTLGKKLMGEIAVLDSGCQKVIAGTYTDEYKRLEQCADTTDQLNDAVKARRKRQFDESNCGNGLESSLDCRDQDQQDGAAFQELQLQRSSLVKSSDPPSLNRVSKSVASSLSAKAEPLAHAESGNTNHRPIEAEVLDVKSRLHQIQIEVSKLRSKQAEMSSDTRPNSSLRSGAQSVLLEEDIDSRTVCVANVHFGATKEAVSLHFAKCGVAAKVIVGQPKGSAYIVFVSKEAVNKAVALDGTSLFSRTLKVFRKGDASAGISHPSPAAQLVPSQLAGKPPAQSLENKGPALKPFPTSQFQWRRNTLASKGAGNPEAPPAPACESETSGAAKQRAPDSGLQRPARSLTYVRPAAGSTTETPMPA